MATWRRSSDCCAVLNFASFRMLPPTSPKPSRLLPQALLAGAVYGAAMLYYLRPIWEVFGNSLAPNAADPLFSVYILKWVGRQIRLGFPDLWDANFFYPARNTLAMSDHMLGPAFAIAWLKNPIASYNLLVVSSFVLCGVGTWWVLRRSGLSSPAALFGGAVFAFSPFRISHLNHLMMLTMQWIPLTLWSFDRLLAERTARRGAVFLLCYGLQVTAGCYFAYMIHVPLLAILASRWPAEGRRRLLAPASLRVLVPVAALALAAATAIFLPYLRLARQLGMAHEDREIGRGGAALVSYLSPAPENLYSPHAPKKLWDRAGLASWQRAFARSENSLFPGFIPTLAAGYGLWEIARRRRAARAAALESAPPPELPATVPATAEATASPAIAVPPALSGRRLLRRLLTWTLAAVALGAFALGDVYTLGFADDLPPLDDWSDATAWTVLGVVLLTCLGLLACLALWRRRAGSSPHRLGSEMDAWHRGLLLAGLLSFALSFPVIYFPLMHVVPGLHSMRAPARFDAFVSLAVAFLAAWGLDRLFERAGLAGIAGGPPAPAVRRRRQAAAAAAWLALGTVLAIELMPRPVRWVRVLSEDEFPEVYTWIRGRPEIRALVEVPLHPKWTETAYMYYSTLHWKPLANGYSGFVPASYDELARTVVLLPDGDGFETLESLGISHIVVHSDLLAKRARGESEVAAEARAGAMVRAWERRFLGRRVELAYAGDPDRVYRIIPVSSSSEKTPALRPDTKGRMDP
jgi:hypothetical protein